MIRAILAGGGVILLLTPLVTALVWEGGSSPSRMTGNDVVTVSLFAVVAGILCLYFSRRYPPASSWPLTVVGWFVGFLVFPMPFQVVAVLLVAVLK